ncbi:hypothetical protein SRHO_G00293380 [Serrasalmus rhombeus]
MTPRSEPEVLILGTLQANSSGHTLSHFSCTHRRCASAWVLRIRPAGVTQILTHTPSQTPPRTVPNVASYGLSRLELGLVDYRRFSGSSLLVLLLQSWPGWMMPTVLLFLSPQLSAGSDCSCDEGPDGTKKKKSKNL